MIENHPKRSGSRAGTKVEEICQSLRDLALEKGPGAQLPTIRVLCETLNTTRVTLSEALNLLEAENILYRKERLGIFVSEKIHSRCIDIILNRSLFMENSATPFWSLLWMHLIQEVKKREHIQNEIFNIHLLKETEKDMSLLPEEAITLMQSKRVDGYMIIGFNAKRVLQTHNIVIPCVTFAGDGPWIVTIDGKDMASEAVSSLIQQGCKKIGFWTYHAQVALQKLEEYIGYRQTLSQHNIPFVPDLVQQPTLPPTHALYDRSLSFQDQGYLLAKEVFNTLNTTIPDGIFIANDLMTDGALIALEEMGIQIGKDVKIATHANAKSPILFGRTQQISAVLDIDVSDITHAMFYMLDALINGQEPAEEVILIKAKLRQQ